MTYERSLEPIEAPLSVDELYEIEIYNAEMYLDAQKADNYDDRPIQAFNYKQVDALKYIKALGFVNEKEVFLWVADNIEAFSKYASVRYILPVYDETPVSIIFNCPMYKQIRTLSDLMEAYLAEKTQTFIKSEKRSENEIGGSKTFKQNMVGDAPGALE